ncbi:hypothetical protein SAMN03080617_01988 [Algoriphagus alkaliphilus]|uniref:Uncharacterized protein n=1 Tax=Algoriphagus alkaliphilus TaxID=279824 RepID=A0A1G5XTX4_9BACT|nr:hypothetical protein [Algoriphagus alkaliphilus]MBA4299106.1 hypothetical protein [Cyclobacterium sp.]SDA73903.1 hypothetical protein SAMN03080617_01988 [Algoriphagus alkaliphilus]
MITQKEMLNHFLPLMESQGKRFKKKSLIRAKKAEPGMVVVTRTSDGIETRNTAEKGDWLVENQTSAKESYLIKADTFEKKYTMMDSLGNGWGCYRPKGEIYAMKVCTEDLNEFSTEGLMEFQAPWKESIVVKPGDYLVISLEKSEIYRVAKKEFLETYEEIKE